MFPRLSPHQHYCFSWELVRQNGPGPVGAVGLEGVGLCVSAGQGRPCVRLRNLCSELYSFIHLKIHTFFLMTTGSCPRVFWIGVKVNMLFILDSMSFFKTEP